MSGLVVMGSLGLCSALVAQLGVTEVSPENRVCQKCHAVPGLTVVDPRTWDEVLLTVDPEVYAHSSHGELSCRECHDYGYSSTLPHSGPVGYPRFLCVNCHRERGDLPHLELPLRREELLRGAHGRAADQLFDCHSCHDPHAFSPVRDEGPALARIRASNQLCLGCHGAMSDRLLGFDELADASSTHDRFPSPDAHFRKVKCVTCHVAPESTTQHDVLPAKDSVGNCPECHRRDSPLFESSYATPAVEVNVPADQSNDSSYDDVYVIGSSRTNRLDRLSFIGLALVVLMILIHVLARAWNHLR